MSLAPPGSPRKRSFLGKDLPPTSTPSLVPTGSSTARAKENAAQPCLLCSGFAASPRIAATSSDRLAVEDPEDDDGGADDDSGWRGSS